MDREPTPEGGPGADLLERDAALATLEDAFAAGRRGEGRLVFISGDAGIGKSALVRAFCSHTAAGARVLLGACDGLRTPSARTARRHRAGRRRPTGRCDTRRRPRAARVVALLDELRSGPPTIVVFEDVHWADEATLDALGMLGRRAEQLGGLAIVTYRDRRAAPGPPSADRAWRPRDRAGVLRIELPPLSLDAVTTLAAPHGVDPVDLHAKTAGNPFFVTEVLAGGSTDIPGTIRDAVLARAARLGGRARALLEAVAIVPQPTELWLHEAIAPGTLDALDECLASGMLRSERHAIAFRHELARMAIEDSVNPHRRVALHRAALQALRRPPEGVVDHARLAHHAEAARDVAAVLELAPAAGERAAAVGAHREAAAQYGRALRHAGGLPASARGELLERRSFECYLSGEQDHAIAALEEALACHRRSGDVRGEGRCLCALSARRWCAGDPAGATAAVHDAVTVFERLGPGPELAAAYAAASSNAMNLERAEAALAWGERALELIDEKRDTETLISQLNNTGTMELLLGRPEGREHLDRSIALAEEARLEHHVGRGYIHLAWAASRRRDFALIERLDEGIDYCTEHGLELWRLYLIVYRAQARLDQGRWSEAAESASYVLRQPHRDPLLRIRALCTLAVVRMRRGDPDVSPLLDEALAIAGGEARPPASLTGRARPHGGRGAGGQGRPRRRCLKRDARDRGRERRRVDLGRAGALAPACRRRRAESRRGGGALRRPPLRRLGGRRCPLATLGCPYEAALALGEADEPEPLRRALAELGALGAGPAAALVARRLRERGVRGVARGPRPSTRANPAGLTAREVRCSGSSQKGSGTGRSRSGSSSRADR